MSLADADLLFQLAQKAFFFQTVQSRDQDSVAGAAGVRFIHGVADIQQILCRKIFIGLPFAGDQLEGGQVGRADAKCLGHADIRYIAQRIVEQGADEGIDQNRIQSGHDTVAGDGIAAFLKGKISADMVDHDEIGSDISIQMRNGLMQSHGMESALF